MSMVSLVAQMVTNLPAVQKTQTQILYHSTYMRYLE